MTDRAWADDLAKVICDDWIDDADMDGARHSIADLILGRCVPRERVAGALALERKYPGPTDDTISLLEELLDGGEPTKTGRQL